MANYLTSNGLIASAKRRAMIPENQSTFKPDDFLAFANEEMMIGLVPSVLSLHEDYFLTFQEVNLVANKSNYPIPSRATGNKLRDVVFKDNNGNMYEMSRILVEDMPSFQGSYSYDNFRYFYIRNNEVVLIPSTGPSVTGKLLFSFYIRPNQLVQENEVGIITNINTLTNELSLDKVPAGFSVAQKFDMIRTDSPHRIITYDLNATSLNSTTKIISFATLPDDLVVGDHIALAGETIVPQIPTDLHVVLAHRIAARCLEAMGDQQGLAAANVKLAEMETKVGNLIDNRVEGSPQKVLNRFSPLKIVTLKRRNWIRG